MTDPATAQPEPEKTQKLPTMEDRIRALLTNVAEDKRPCRNCGEPLAFVRHRNGKLAPYTMAGVNHFIDCPGAQQFRKESR